MREPNWDDFNNTPFPKPPLGARPYWVVVPERLANLCEAIKNGTEYDKMEEWAWELLWQIRMARFLRERKQNDKA